LVGQVPVDDGLVGVEVPRAEDVLPERLLALAAGVGGDRLADPPLAAPAALHVAEALRMAGRSAYGAG